MDVNQLWAEAVAAYRAGEQWPLTNDERDMSQGINERYEVADPLEDLLIRHYEIDPRMASDETWTIASITILNKLHTLDWRRSSPQAEAMALAAAMKKLGAIKPDDKITDPVSRQKLRGYLGVRERVSSEYSAKGAYYG